ncbi:helix-turn-helix domain-containing protein [Streptomyces sp. NBC_00872]|uniref:helix-turn-helix domain-containing protein n=1 Tax=Streptomyces sp. NBC_00872 TaxID=2903686 RepID=UPI0038654969|nr:helix-turn-helix domain-containing protein [Streptomyces sp. NBC_00872]
MTTPSTPPEATTTAEPAALLPGPWYSTEELARILHVDPSTLRRWRTAHPRQGPPYVRVSKRVVLYSARDVEHWIAQRRVSPGPAA